jgi:hypothetical protein
MKTTKKYINKLLAKTGYQVNKTSTLMKMEQVINDLHNLSADLNELSVNQQNEIAGLNNQLESKKTNRFDKMIFHIPENGLPEIPLARTITRNNEKRLKIAERLIITYHKAIKEEKNIKFEKPKEDLWSELIPNELNELLNILDKQNPAELADYMMNFGKHHTWFGGLSFALGSYNNIKSPEYIAFSFFDKFVCMAESLGILPFEHPEHGRWNQNIYHNLDELIDKIEKELDIDITPPQDVISIFGIYTKKGIFNYRHINSLYTAFRIKSLLSGVHSPDICEYGGGLGTVGYYLSKMGISNYTIFDLPLVNMFAGHFLLNCLPEDMVVLYGEDYKDNAIKLYPYWMCAQMPEKKFDLSINQDSFPEIDEFIVKKYISDIERTTSKYFLSINHEAQSPMNGKENPKAQLNISEIMKTYKNFNRFYRFHYWVREGYIEELYKIKNPDDL